jgi:hypothetical protein
MNEIKRLVVNKSKIKSTQEEDDVVFAVDANGNIYIKNKQWQKNKKQKATISKLQGTIQKIEANVSLVAEKDKEKVSWGWKIAGGIGIGLVTFSSKFVENFVGGLISDWKTAGGNKQKYYICALAVITIPVTLLINVPTISMLFYGGIFLCRWGWTFVKFKWS